MNFEKFKELIKDLEKARKRCGDLYDSEIDLIKYNDLYYKIIDNLMSSVFTDEGKDWIDWYLYERIGFSGNVNPATDKNGNPICYDIKSLWKVVKTELK
jgi:hypothetical protein